MHRQKKKRNEFRNSRKSSTSTIKINFLVDADVLHSGSTHGANRLGFAEKEKIIKRNNMIKQNVETKCRDKASTPISITLMALKYFEWVKK